MMKRWGDRFSGGATTATSAAASFALHVLLIGGAVYATTVPEVQDFLEREANIIARFLAPPNRVGGQSAQREQVKFVAIPVADAQPGTRPRIDAEPAPAQQQVSGIFQKNVEARDEVQGPDTVFTSLEVDSAAARFAWSAAPQYPAAMLEQKREGYVKARWIVDEAGYADTTSLELVDFTSPEFAKAVRDALPFMRFSPAKMGAKSVRQLVEQEFAFRINTVMVAPPTKKPET
jgi:hypothetical protein